MGKIILNGVVYTVDIDIDNETPTFTEAQTRANIQSGESVSTLFGKIKKWFSDLKAVAFSGSYTDLTDKPTIPADNSVRDYNNSVYTKFGYSTSGMASSAVTWVGAWDDTTSGEYRLRAIKQSDLRVAYAATAGSATDSTKLPLTGGTLQSSSDTPLTLKSNNNSSVFARYRGADNTTYGYIGARSDKKPYFYDTGYHRIALWDELLLQYATPFRVANSANDHVRFTFTGLSQYEAIHLLIFARTCSGEILAECSSTGFSSITRTVITDGPTYHLGIAYTPNNGFTFTVQTGQWSAVWGIWIHPHFGSASMTVSAE